MPTPNLVLGGVALPADLQWTDEHAWSAVARSQEYSLTGALLVQEAVKQAGRPITLAGDWAWISTATLLALQALNDTAGWEGTLVLADERALTVAFRDEGIVAEPVFFEAPSGAKEDRWTVTLKLVEV